ncbi:hypothetical protein FNV43_RR12401 [Rhamnella rubrinervis]|uniref:Sulfate transporter n=1 Tax=Rhamnella rubrinervis TaxID=2594499 RepID=A0A8K0H7K1_9ROSA|nr:hypothetical protein FNV43_RR12401 [Rhamnella rubrinervis]
MPIQPMKSIVAVALSNGSNFGVLEIMAAGICTGGIMLVLGVTGLMQMVYKLVPSSIVSGVQLAQGLLTAVKYAEELQDFSKSKDDDQDRLWLGLDGLVLAISCACFVILVDGVGHDHHKEHDDQLSEKAREITLIITQITLTKLGKHAWKEGFIKGTIPQLPLSIMNSVIAVCKLSSDLFPGKDFSATLLSVTMGSMNVVGSWFGAMPCCHGAGGLAGHYKFGGRSGGGFVGLLGAVNLALGLVLGSSLVKVLVQFPVGFLGVMLMFAGIEMAIHGFQEHKFHGRLLCDAHLHCGFASGFRLGGRFCLWDCCTFAS